MAFIGNLTIFPAVRDCENRSRLDEVSAVSWSSVWGRTVHHVYLRVSCCVFFVFLHIWDGDVTLLWTYSMSLIMVCHLSATSLRPHHWRPCNTALVAPARTCGFQGGRHGISRAAWSRSTISEPANPYCRPTWSSPTSLIFQPFTPCSVIPSIHRWTALVSCCSIHSLELSYTGHPVITLFDCFSSTP